MPGGDRTGPMGMGPMTGRGAGLCAGFAAPGFASGGQGFFGRGRGGGGGRGGRGRRNMFHATGLTGWQRAGMVGPMGDDAVPPQPQPLSPEQELETLKQQAAGAAATLEQIGRRIDELEARTTAE